MEETVGARSGKASGFPAGRAAFFVAATAVSTKPLMTLLVLRGFWLRVLSGGVKVGVIEAPVELGLATLSRRPARRELDGPVLAAFARTDPFFARRFLDGEPTDASNPSAASAEREDAVTTAGAEHSSSSSSIRALGSPRAFSSCLRAGQGSDEKRHGSDMVSSHSWRSRSPTGLDCARARRVLSKRTRFSSTRLLLTFNPSCTLHSPDGSVPTLILVDTLVLLLCSRLAGTELLEDELLGGAPVGASGNRKSIEQ